MLRLLTFIIGLLVGSAAYAQTPVAATCGEKRPVVHAYHLHELAALAPRFKWDAVQIGQKVDDLQLKLPATLCKQDRFAVHQGMDHFYYGKGFDRPGEMLEFVLILMQRAYIGEKKFGSVDPTAAVRFAALQKMGQLTDGHIKEISTRVRVERADSMNRGKAPNISNATYVRIFVDNTDTAVLVVMMREKIADESKEHWVLWQER